MKNYPVELINNCKLQFRETMSAGMFRTTILKLLMLATGPLTTETVKHALCYIEAPTEISDDNLRQIMSRLRSDNDFNVLVTETGEFLSLTDPIFTARTLFKDSNPFTIIDSDLLVDCIKNNSASASTDEDQSIINNYSVLSNLNALNTLDYDVISTIQFSEYNEHTHTYPSIINAGEHSQYNLLSILTDSSDELGDPITEKAERALDKLSICHQFNPVNIMFVPNLVHCHVNTSDLKDNEKLMKALLTQAVLNGKGMLLMLAKVLETDYPTVNGFIQHLHDLTDSLPKECNIKSEAWFSILKLLEGYGDSPTSEIHRLINGFSKHCEPSMISILNKRINETTNQQRQMVFKYFAEKHSPWSDNFTVESGIPTGQMVIFESPTKLLPSVPYLYTCDLSFETIFKIFKNIGMNFWSYDIVFHAWPPQTLPVACSSDRNQDYPLYLRNTMRLNGSTVAIENISADMGGLLRVSYFLNREVSTVPEVTIIALVSDDYILADGNHLFTSKTLYNQPHPNSEKNTLSAGFKNVLEFLIGEKTTQKNHYKYLPFYKKDVVFITYSQFEEAKHSRVYPWLYNYKTDEIIFRGR